MLRAITGFCLRFPMLVLFVGLAVATAGIGALINANYDVFPEFAAPSVTIDTNLPGFAPRDVEALATTPIEDALSGTPGLALLRSQSITGLSIVTATFHGGTTLDLDRERVAQRLAGLGALLPAGVIPVLVPSQSATGTVQVVGLTSDHKSIIDMTEITRAVIRPALLAVPGVANVVIFGAEPLTWQVQPDPARMAAAHIGLAQLEQAASQSTAIAGAGLVETPSQRLLLQSHGQPDSTEALAQTLIARRPGGALTLGDVATITAGARPPTGAAFVGAKPGLLLIISAQYGSNTLDVARGVGKVLHRLAPGLAAQSITLDPDALQPVSFIVQALHDVRDSLLIGAGLILVVLFFALRDWRISLISFLAIPLSLLVAALVLRYFGVGLNTLSLGGLAIALGEVVDDSIVDVENIHRRLQMSPRPMAVSERLRIILDASLEVRGTIIFATLSVVFVFLPVFAITGTAGRMFAPLAIAYITAILASLVVAVTITPALSMLLLGRAKSRRSHFVEWARQFHGRAMERADGHFRSLVYGLFGIALLALASLAALPTSFLPRFHENEIIAHFLAPPCTSLPEMKRLALRSINILQELPEVGHVVAHLGHANLGNGHPDINKSELDITLSQSGNRDSIGSQRKILAALGGVPSVRFWANTFLTERIHETLSGSTAPVVISFFGTDLAALDRDAAQAAQILRAIPGVGSVSTAAPPKTPTLSITLDRPALVSFGFRPAAVLDAIQTAYAGLDVARIYSNGTSWPVTVILPETKRGDPASIKNLPLTAPDGTLVPLGALVHITEENGRSVILHQDAQRIQSINIEIASGGAAAFVAHARTALAALHLAPGTYYAISGTATASSGALRTLLLESLRAVLAILGLMTIALKNRRIVSLLALNLPFALIGGVAAIWLAGLPLSLGAAVGFVTLFGITLRNALMLLSHYRHLVLKEGENWSATIARKGAQDRVVPILLTALVTALGLLPLAFGASRPGQEIEGPMALVILGGLLTSTFLSLIVLPGLSARFLTGKDFEL